jgi:hypothetical protein
MSDKRFALLIDSDNISAKYIDSILDEMTRQGVATYRRIYGDFTDYHMNKWKSELAEQLKITPCGAFAIHSKMAFIFGSSAIFKKLKGTSSTEFGTLLPS